MVLKNLFTGQQWDFPSGSEAKTSACNAGDPGSILGLGRVPGEGNGNPLQYSCLENPMVGEAWWATVHGVAKSRIQLTDFTNGDIGNRLMDTGRGEERVRCMGRITWKLILAYVKDSQWKFAVWLRKLKQGLCINLEGWDAEGDGREVSKGRGYICTYG